jgi:serine phosphatase RsbU (regulator of sigma subunit)
MGSNFFVRKRMIWFKQDRLREVVREAVESVVRSANNSLEVAASKFRTVEDLESHIQKLKTSVADLEIQKGKKDEEYARKEREIEHKVGLERKRQEQELTLAKRETSVAVREENLSKDQERFKEEMDFQRGRLEGEVASLRELVNEMLKRLPSAEIITNVEVKRGSRK